MGCGRPIAIVEVPGMVRPWPRDGGGGGGGGQTGGRNLAALGADRTSEGSWRMDLIGGLLGFEASP